MSHVLAGLLPAEAADLYQRLLSAGRLRIEEHSDLVSSVEMRRLIDSGFARERYIDEPVIVPVEPSLAIEQALLHAQRRLLAEQRMLIRAREQIDLLQRNYFAGAELGASVDVLTDPERIGALSVELCLSRCSTAAKCLRPAGGSTIAGELIEQVRCDNGDPSQHWKAYDPGANSTGAKWLINLNSGKCVEVPGWDTRADTLLTQSDCVLGWKQFWFGL
jgi:hypothetical protein